MAAVLARNPLLDLVTVDLTGKLAVELLQVGVDILRQRLLKNGPAQQLRGGIAGQLAESPVDAQHPACLVDLDNSRASMSKTGTQPFIARPHPILRPRVGRLQKA